MGFIKRAIRDGVRRGVGDAIGNAVRQAVEPTATELANKAARRLDDAAGSVSRPVSRSVGNSGGLESALFGLENAAQRYATEVAKNFKVCPGCGQPSPNDKTFCPSCGEKLPEDNLAQGAVCTSCGAQNVVGTKFCTQCGTKLPSAVAEEQARQSRDQSVLARWATELAPFPRWDCGGFDYEIEHFDSGVSFKASFESSFAAKQAVNSYRELLQQNGFVTAGKYPDISHLYKMEHGVCCHVDTEHCFEGDPDCPSFYFDMREPTGGFDYRAPEPKPQLGIDDLKDLKKLFRR